MKASPERPGHRATTQRRNGEVGDFDEAAGLGVVYDGAGGARYPFHCTQIADGSRSILRGAHVSFVVIAGRGGRWEAGDIRARAGGTGPVVEISEPTPAPAP